MKTFRLLFTVLPLLTAGALLAAPSASKDSSRVNVTFSHPEKFTDVKEDQFGSEKGRDAILEQIRDYIDQRAPRYMKNGESLSVTFTDIDLAGDFEPWRGPKADDIRIIRAIYPPRMDLSFKVTDASGAVVKEGTRELRNLDFQSELSVNTQDSLRFEKSLLDDFLRSLFPRR
ncbi:DUF3016 domain-containing protein [Horticoccus luteus]|uniref:DUF3016 domain-containing protein n=1 Tax=Horticoccus luteus TaxID=2862869 RepID=A0A8F9TV13_9BACT|nr:DUF3016 domain-containing protein [Horticoccus luteus]QYM78635.1 DUF3016 domain-containing protein [Horticoccus luteus]